MLNELIATADFEPRVLSGSDAWVGHIPFAAWLVRRFSPGTIVELGTYAGNSYFTFCQAVEMAKLPSRCYAIDTWAGDEHGGYYDEDIYLAVAAHNQKHYADFSHLMRMTFDQAAQEFGAGSIDLLHIDGLHTYEAVRHDFETWLPKLAPGSLVLFHDINVREKGFGVWRYWDELCKCYPRHIQFPHSNGLGVLQIDGAAPGFLPWLEPDWADRLHFVSYFKALGKSQQHRFWHQEMLRQRDEQMELSAECDKKIESFQIEVQQLNAEVDLLNAEVNQLHSRLASQNDLLEQKVLDMQGLTSQLEIVLSSRSWLLTAPLREANRWLRKKKIESTRRIGILFDYLRRGDISGLLRHYKRRRIYRQQGQGSPVSSIQEQYGAMRWAVMATPHTLFIAHLVAEQLSRHDWTVEILTAPPTDFNHDYYVVICPQMFNRLPPDNKRIVFQMEQSVSSRWFSQDYLQILGASIAVLDYSLDNISFLDREGITYPKVYYLPVGASKDYGSRESSNKKQYDVLFYGDCNSSSRRRKMLTALNEKYNVHIASEVFGSDIQNKICQARVVVNLHYYEDALLEMPRIQECLSLGVPVVSEASRDQKNYPELAGAVRFFEQGSVADMLVTVAEMLAAPPSPEEISDAVRKGHERWSFFFNRFLIGMGFLTVDVLDNLSVQADLFRDSVVLSMPETIHRRRTFERNNLLPCKIFDGIRYQPAWVGCGLSYSFLARQFLKGEGQTLTVMEDDVLLPDNIQEHLDVVYDYLGQNSDWDLFVGVIADLHEKTKILRLDQYRGLTFVTIDRMTSMVFNIYSRRALDLLSLWNSNDRNYETNTIDRFLENKKSLKVVVLLPFLVGHREDLFSTLWGFKNYTYLEMIKTSEKKLIKMAKDFNEESPAT